MMGKVLSRITRFAPISLLPIVMLWAAATNIHAETGFVGDQKVEVKRISQGRFIYPRAALRREIEGFVKIQITLGETGRVVDAFVLEASPPNRFEKNALKKELLKIAPELLKFAQPVWLKLSEYNNARKKILFEGAQGILLDVDHGTYPYVTSSNTVPAMAATGSGCGPDKINYVLGITKAYTTRVGEGPFPTELKNEIGEKLGIVGKEFGTVTSRKRRCGWFDGVLVRQTIKISGIDGIALTKLDVLDQLDEIKMCIAYEVGGKKLDYLPAAVDDQLKAKPIYKNFKGWNCSTKGIKKFDELPQNAKNYVKELEKFIETKVASISTSPERNDTILIVDPFKI